MVNKDKIKKILKKYYKLDMNQVTVHDDGVVDVIGNVTLTRKTKSFRIQFGEVGGYFYCPDNQLTSLAGAPTKVGGDFWCHMNQLKSLAGAPTEVGRDFSCSINQLTSLAGAPKEVGGYFDCHMNQLTSLVGGPNQVRGRFICISNKLTSLVGAPHDVGGDFYCSNNPLTSLEGMPDRIGNSIELTYAPNLPVLRCLVASKIHLFRELTGLNSIMNDPRWVGKGKKGSLMCAAALIKAGFEGNAKW